MREVIAASIQMRVGYSSEEVYSEVKGLIEDAASRGADVICLPEYFFGLSRSYEATYERTIEFLADTSRDYDLIIAGNVIERSTRECGYYNTCLVYENGRLIGRQRKVHPTENEERFGLKRGDSFDVIKSGVCTLGVLLCADILYPEACRVLGLKGAEIVFNPVVSTYKDDDITKDARRAMFISRSYDNCYFLIKAGGVGRSPFGKEIVGRSLIAAPWGILASAKDERKTGVILANLDFDSLRRVREENYSLRRRVKGAYLPLIE
jgi:predicted amidohydrolase